MSNSVDRIQDIGPQPQAFNIEQATKDNTDYRSVAWSGRYLQVTLMSIPPGGDIGLEAHPRPINSCASTSGNGRARMGATKDQLTFEKDVSDGWCVLVPAGTGTTSPTPEKSRCRSMRSTRLPTMPPARSRRRLRWPRPTKRMSRRRGRCSPNMAPTSTDTHTGAAIRKLWEDAVHASRRPDQRRTPENGDSAGSSGELMLVSPEPCWVTLASNDSVTLAAGWNAMPARAR